MCLELFETMYIHMYAVLQSYFSKLYKDFKTQNDQIKNWLLVCEMGDIWVVGVKIGLNL